MNDDKIYKRGYNPRHNCKKNRCRRGASSFDMHDSGLVFEKLALKKGDTILDLGCGAGDYAIHAAKIAGKSGKVYALDLWQEMLDGIVEGAAKQGLNNIHTVVCDIRHQVDIEDNSIDICLIATVLHTMDSTETRAKLFAEIRRVLKCGGKLAIIECKKYDAPFGPPMHLRLSPEELEKELKKSGFEKADYTDLGINYLMQFDTN